MSAAEGRSAAAACRQQRTHELEVRTTYLLLLPTCLLATKILAAQAYKALSASVGITAPVNAMYGLHEALLMVKEEGLEQSWEKHRTMHASLYENLSGLGLEFVVDGSYRLPQLNLVKVPKGVDEAAVREQLLQQFNLEIGAGLGAFAGKVWRIGLMGYSARQENVQLCTSALRACLPSC